MARLAIASSWFKLSTGRIVAEHAAVRGHDVRPVTDLEDIASLRTALLGADAVVLVPKRGDARRHTEQATRTVLREAARDGASPHVVLLSSFAVGHGPAHPLNRTSGALLPGRIAAERALRGSGLPYTVVRATWMTDDPPASHALTLSQEPYVDGMVARADIADTIVAAIESPGARRTTFALFNEPGEPLTDWAAAFARLRRDTDDEDLT
ncbi:SDR family oxidoreductase [Streptomyces sp. A3M-1-3]|uniref:NAD(P)-binding oxidoreductase n=1 Tax=Streptomyces sp. A3M-1-3 TaxID=2962044 RepID=UPI0020B8B29D|nr:NAD(P)-binding oxidoreductase [Streptomyces sp. A3M-1-3]MCP3821648.1 SDR family oxidoreductase [Streptomyces sp. A3M-1-3]